MIPADLPTVARFYLDAWRTAYRTIVPPAVVDAHAAFTSERRERRRQHRLLRTARRRRAAVWVAVRESTSIAFAIAGPSRDPGAGDATGELWAIYAAPGAWGAGVGPALLARAMRWLRAQGYEDGRLWVLRHNHRAERFYRRYGWRPDGTTFRFRIDGYPLVERRYRRRLTPRA